MGNRWALNGVYETTADLYAALKESIAYWQGVLRLQDWNIELSLRRRCEMSVANVIGSNHHWQDSKDSIIELPMPEDLLSYVKFQGEEKDYEITLVHELLHLHFAPFAADEDKDPHGNTYQELAINTLARSLVHLDRKGSLTPE